MSGIKRAALAIMPALLIVGAAYFLVYGPRQAEAADLSAQQDDLFFEQETLQASLDQADEYSSALADHEVQRAVLRIALPPSPQVGEFVTQIETLADSMGIDVLALSPEEASAADPSGIEDVTDGDVADELSVDDEDLEGEEGAAPEEEFVDEEFLDEEFLDEESSTVVTETFAINIRGPEGSMIAFFDAVASGGRMVGVDGLAVLTEGPGIQSATATLRIGSVPAS